MKSNCKSALSYQIYKILKSLKVHIVLIHVRNDLYFLCNHLSKITKRKSGKNKLQRCWPSATRTVARKHENVIKRHDTSRKNNVIQTYLVSCYWKELFTSKTYKQNTLELFIEPMVSTAVASIIYNFLPIKHHKPLFILTHA